MIARFLKDLGKNSAYALVFGKLLKKTEGARLLTARETSDLLSSRNIGLLLDGQEGRLSERESFQNVAVIARVGAGKTSRYTYLCYAGADQDTARLAPSEGYFVGLL